MATRTFSPESIDANPEDYGCELNEDHVVVPVITGTRVIARHEKKVILK